MRIKLFLSALCALCIFACGEPTTTTTPDTTEETTSTTTEATDDFVWNPENFADKKMVRYQIPGWEKLSLQQKQLVYYLTQAGLAGRDIMYDQNYRHNLPIRRAIDKIMAEYKGERSGADWDNFVVYAKNIWFSNGIHHHYSMDKFNPEFSQEYFKTLTDAVGVELKDAVLTAMFDSSVDAKKVNLNSEEDIVLTSAINFYDSDITQAEATAYYKSITDKNDPKPVEYSLNSKLIRKRDGKIYEAVYAVNGMYGPALKEVVKWLRKAEGVAENAEQGKALGLLADYYETGDLRKWSEYNVTWAAATEGDIDYINGFVEVYNDPLGYTGSYETIVQIKDFDASERMAVVAKNAQWFEDNSTIMEEHKKKNVTGVSYKVVTVAGEAGDASPATPIGVNLPNANWIRQQHGSKSVSLGNIIAAYENADGPGMLTEFAHDEKEIEYSEKYGSLGGKMHTALHEVIGHASGQINEGVGTPKQTLENYASTLEEGRADLVALYFIMDPKMIEYGLMENDGAAIAEYDGYIRNGLMVQLRRIEPGKDIEESHMRNRQMVAAWAYEKGKADNVIEKVTREGKTYFEIRDYQKLRELFGQLLRETQRITSEGDYDAAKELIETYGVKVDKAIHKEVLARSEKLNIPPYGGFINPRLVPVMDANGNITDVKVEYPDDFTKQMLEYAKNYSFLK